MGCGSAKEKIEDLMMVYKLQRMEIQMEKEKELKKLAEIEGHDIERHQVPDYIDPIFAKEKRLYLEQRDNKENQDSNKNQPRIKKTSNKSINGGDKKKKKKQ